MCTESIRFDQVERFGAAVVRAVKDGTDGETEREAVLLASDTDYAKVSDGSMMRMLSTPFSFAMLMG